MVKVFMHVVILKQWRLLIQVIVDACEFLFLLTTIRLVQDIFVVKVVMQVVILKQWRLLIQVIVKFLSSFRSVR